ncbi:MAG: S-methyl-5-thioribose kinase [Clostridia bacterium]|nr:S-methyl-5-thioribose kinase [Clostridia bacterium]
MSFYALDTKTAVDYVMGRPALGRFFPKGSSTTAREIGDGNLNQVFIIRSGAASVILKQALPYLRVAGDSWPLTQERMRFETQALELEARLAPGLTPQIYDTDPEMELVVMENLEGLEVMRKPLVERARFPKFAGQISDFLARTLLFTSDLYLTGVEKKRLQARYIDPDMTNIQEDFVFTNPFMESPDNNWDPLIDAEVQAVRRNGALKIAIAEMKEGYMTHGQSIIHSDLHTGSIMLNEDDMRVIDPEFCFCGPMGFDIGALLENIVLNCLSHFAHTADPAQRAEYQNYLLDMVRDVWNLFAQKFDALWAENPKGDLMPVKYWDYPDGELDFALFRQRYIRRLLQDTAGYGGCKMLRRMMGIVNVWDISSIADPEKRAECERMAIHIGSRWVLEHKKYEAIGDYLSVVREEAGL